MTSLKKQGTKAFIWDFLGKIATQGISFIGTIFLSRLLNPSDFGLIAMIMVIIGIASVFSDIGLGRALIQRSKVLPIHYSSVFYFNIFVGLILTVITYFSASWVAKFYLNDALVPLIQVMSLSFVINAFSNTHSTKLSKELNYSALTKAQFFASLVGVVVGVTLAFHDAGVWSLVVQALLSSITYNILVWTISKWTPVFLFSFKALMQLWGFGFRMFLSAALDAIFTRLDYLIIGKLFMPVTLGFFQRAKSLDLMIAQFSSGSLLSVLFPILSNIKNDLPQFQNIIIKMMGIICFIVFLLMGGLYLISEELIIFIFGMKWLKSAYFFKILILSGFGFPISALLVNILMSRGNSKAFLRLEIYKKLLFAINFVVLYKAGIDMYLYGLIVATILSVLLNIFFASREIKISFIKFIEPIVDQAVIAAIAIAGTLYLTTLIKMEGELIPIIAKGFFFTIIYLLSNKVFKTYSYRVFTEQVVQVLKLRF